MNAWDYRIPTSPYWTPGPGANLATRRLELNKMPSKELRFRAYRYGLYSRKQLTQLVDSTVLLAILLEETRRGLLPKQSSFEAVVATQAPMARLSIAEKVNGLTFIGFMTIGFVGLFTDSHTVQGYCMLAAMVLLVVGYAAGSHK